MKDLMSPPSLVCIFLQEEEEEEEEEEDEEEDVTKPMRTVSERRRAAFLKRNEKGILSSTRKLPDQRHENTTPL